MSKTARHICALAPLPSGVPDQIEIMPVGDLRFAFSDRRVAESLRLDPSDVDAVIAASFEMAPGNVLPIDFDHRSMSPQGTADSRAAGWITGMHIEGQSVMASVEWTEDGRRAIEGKSYRFLSPVFKTLRSNGRVVLIEGAGLVNNPALPEIRQIASKDENMNPIDQIAELLGLSADEPDKIVERVEALHQADTQLASVTQAAGVTGDDAVTQVCAKLKAGNKAPDPSKFVPMAMYQDLQGQLASVQKGVVEDKTEAALERARDEGKLTPAMEDWATQLASADIEAFENWAASAPVVVALKAAPKKIAGQQPPKKTEKLTDVERQVASLTGVAEDKFLETRNGMKEV